jgi:acetyl-CoA C-acetyltransferase
MADSIVISGWGQVTQPKTAQPPYLDPIDMMEAAARQAGELAGPGALTDIDAILVVRTQSRLLLEPEIELARRLGATPRLARVSGIGGQVPQQFVNQAAGMLARGEVESVLICGAETFYPRSAEAARGESALLQGIPADYDAEDAIGASEIEQRHGLSLPIHGFPLFENALWAQSGLSKAAWLAQVGELWSGFSAVAAAHPNAWTREVVPAARIVTPAPDNRPIAYPYTKRMVSLVMADIGAAVILTTAARAAARPGGAGRVAYFLGGGYAKDRQRFLIDKERYTQSPAIAKAAARAEIRAGVRAADIDCFDLYSCFPCAVQVARRHLGIAADDPRPLTQTGGLGFFGGPGSNYALHGIASMAETLASGRQRIGMTTALGWFMHKYAVGIYSDQPGKADLTRADQEDETMPEAGNPPVDIDPAPRGAGTIETWTVVYDREQAPSRAILYGRTAAGRRFVANAPHDAASYAALTGENVIGRGVHLAMEASTGRTLAVLAD